MNIISFIFLVVCIIMLLHITLTNFLFAIDLRRKDFKISSKVLLIKTAIDVAVLCTIIVIGIFIKDTDYVFILDTINGFIIGYIISNYYIKHL